MIKKFFISPPFGNYIKRSWATSVNGTYTLHRRSGLIRQIIKTVRPIKGGWVNKIGFRNPGIKSIKKFKEGQIYSIAGLSIDEWDGLYDIVPASTMIELNVSCPNVGETNINYEIFKKFAAKYKWISVKVPPTDKVGELISTAYWAGIRIFHLCNTIPVEQGGESGERLKEKVIPIITEMKMLFPNMIIIAGGGIYGPTDIEDYKKAGADYFSLATIWFTPWKVLGIKNKI